MNLRITTFKKPPMSSIYSSTFTNLSFFKTKSFQTSSSSQPISLNFISHLRKSPSPPPFLGNSTSIIGKRFLSIMSTAKSGNLSQESCFTGSQSFFRNVLANMEAVYLNRNPTAKSILKLVQSVDKNNIFYDHLAFRTFGINDHGIDSLADFFIDFGYTRREELSFPAKKLRAFWFSPPTISHDPTDHNGNGAYGPLPRVFISELIVEQLSQQTQEVIRKYTGSSQNGRKHAVLASTLGSLTWEKPLHSEFLQLARESEYAAWTLVNGYAVNHVTISTHQLKSHMKNIKTLNQFIEANGYRLNSEGGILKVSPDGFLLQSSTLADSDSFEFSDGITTTVPCSYIEFAERLVLPQYKHLPETEIKEYHRRDGFEVGNADKIFESTSKQQLTA